MKRTSDSSSVRFPTMSLQFDTRSSRWSWRHSSSWSRKNYHWITDIDAHPVLILLQDWGVSSQSAFSTCPVSVFSLHHLPRSVMQRFWSSGSNFTSRALWWRILWTSTLQSLVSCTWESVIFSTLVEYYDRIPVHSYILMCKFNGWIQNHMLSFLHAFCLIWRNQTQLTFVCWSNALSKWVVSSQNKL